MRERANILALLQDPSRWARVSAPMVRYSKLPFREVVREYGVDIAYTPMIMADSFSQSEIARNHEFRTCESDTPLVAQFGAKNGQEFAKSIDYIAPYSKNIRNFFIRLRYVDAVDLNCGCPQKWAVAEGIGASLLKDETADGTWSRLSSILAAGLEAASRHPYLPVSVKIRVLSTPEETVELVRRVEALGAAWITVHGRTKNQRPSDKPNYDLVKLAKESVRIPVIANGDVFTLQDAERIQAHTGVNGVMAARGLLENPGLFAGLPQTTWTLLDSYVQRAVEYGTTTAVFHHHISQMTAGGLLSKNHHKLLNGLTNTSIPAILEYLESCRPSDTAIAL